MWERRIAIFFIVAALLGMVVCAGLLIQAYITHQSAFELLGYGSSKPGFELLAYSSEALLILGFLTQIIAINISTVVDTEHKRLDYFSTWIAALLILLSFGLFFISHQPEQGWWRDFSAVNSVTACTTLNFSLLVGAERKRLRDILKIITFFLLLGACVLQIFLSGA
ncbi:hypothetical protein C7B70_24450 [Chlorogloea sp. CCALA 695]|nr:hypothetical protein C7B70_24450 [Chlorogloea sp. CCALA 695]